MEFILLSKMRELVISTLSSFVIKDINENIVHTTLEVSNKAKKNY